jgi:hypothetical protein
MTGTFILGVPTADRADLVSLAEQIENDPKYSEYRYFDGAAFVETLLPMVISTATWATLRTWIRARADVQKATRIACQGIEIEGMNRKDAERIIQILSDRLAVQDGDE